MPGGLVLKGLFKEEELRRWRGSDAQVPEATGSGREDVLLRHGNESFYADNTRGRRVEDCWLLAPGRYAYPKLSAYVRGGGEEMIFVSDTLRGAFGRAWRFAQRRGRRLLRDFAERPIFSVGVRGGAVPSHEEHPETWQALLSGRKAWWLAPKGTASDFQGWEDPCGAVKAGLERKEVKLCVQQAGEAMVMNYPISSSYPAI